MQGSFTITLFFALFFTSGAFANDGSSVTVLEKTTMTIADCFHLLETNNVEAKMSKLRLGLEQDGLEEQSNEFNTGFSADYNVSSYEFGGATVDSALFGTRRDNENMSFQFDQPLKLGGTVGLKYDQSKAETNSTFGNPESYSSALSLTWQQPLFKKAGSISSLYGYNKQRLTLDRQRLSTEDDIIDLRYNMLLEVLDCLRKQETIGIRQRSLATNRLLLNASQAKQKAGLASNLDVLESKLQLTEAQTNLRKSKGELDKAYNKLARRLGVTLHKERSIDFPIEYETEVISESEAIKKAMLHRRSLSRQRIEVRLREIDLDYYKNEDKPDIALTTTLQRSGEGVTRNSGNELDNQSYMVGLKYTTRFGLRDEVVTRRTYEKQLALSRLELEKQQDDVKLEVKNFIQELDDAKAVVKLAKEQKLLAEEKFKFTQRAYENQLRTLMHVLEAEEDMTAKSADYVTSLVNHLTARLNLLKSMGAPLSLDSLRSGAKK